MSILTSPCSLLYLVCLFSHIIDFNIVMCYLILKYQYSNVNLHYIVRPGRTVITTSNSPERYFWKFDQQNMIANSCRNCCRVSLLKLSQYCIVWSIHRPFLCKYAMFDFSSGPDQWSESILSLMESALPTYICTCLIVCLVALIQLFWLQALISYVPW